jgi:hypothetical protein
MDEHLTVKQNEWNCNGVARSCQGFSAIGIKWRFLGYTTLPLFWSLDNIYITISTHDRIYEM